MHELHQNKDQGIATDIVVMDFSKAFDKVAHNKLLHKIKWYGVDNQTAGWIRAFLHKRQQTVVVEGCKGWSQKYHHILKCNLLQMVVGGPKPNTDYQKQ